jgi:glycine cleavage system H protein
MSETTIGHTADTRPESTVHRDDTRLSHHTPPPATRHDGWAAERDIPSNRLYTSTHSWLTLGPDEVLADHPLRVGITAAALVDTDIVLLELPAVRQTVTAHTPCAHLVTPSAAIPVYAPIDGLVTIVNVEAVADPRLVAQDPYHRGWFFALLPIRSSSVSGLLTATRYRAEGYAPG